MRYYMISAGIPAGTTTHPTERFMEIRIPEVGESVREALLAKWFKANGEAVRKDDPLCEIETDKITLDLHADADGVLTILTPEGTTVAVGTVVATLAESNAAVVPVMSPPAPVVSPSLEEQLKAVVASPSVRNEMRRQGISPVEVAGTGQGGRITAEDLQSRVAAPVQAVAALAPSLAASAVQDIGNLHSRQAELFSADVAPAQPPRPASQIRSEEPPSYGARREERKAMSPIRKKISEHLVAARQQTAMLTTFNEADLSRIKYLRQRYREQFIQRHGAPLGLMPFFVKACVEALKEFPAVNARIDGADIVYHQYYDISVAISGEKGLVVPVLRDADRMHLHEIDRAIEAYSEKIRTNKLAVSDLEGGTFTITNGGIFGSLLSTPIINIPQSAVLGMHAIQDRPVVRDGQIVIRPMMYLALSYDHRMIDGREAVTFLKKVREYIEEPEELLLEG